jgi:hypothetical protein
MLQYFMATWNFDSPLVYIMAIWYILWSFGIFSLFWYVVPRKIWQPWFLAQNLQAGKKVQPFFSTKVHSATAASTGPGLPDVFVFKPKISIWETFSGPHIGKCIYI